MSELIDTVQLQNIEDSIVDLFEVTLPTGTTVYLFSGLQDGTDSVYFTSELPGGGYTSNEYIAIPIKLEGISFSASGAPNRPTLSLANIPVLTKVIQPNETTLLDIAKEETVGILTQEGIYKNEDFLGSVVVYRSTLGKHLKVNEFDTTAPVEFPSQKFVLDRVAQETSMVVEFELAVTYDVEGVQLPFRQVNGRYCPWEYQGNAIAGRGGCTWPLDSRGRFYDKDDNPITVSAIGTWSSSSTYTAGQRVKTFDGDFVRVWEALRPTPPNKNPRTQKYYWKRVDACGKFIRSCKIRFQGSSAYDATVNPGPPDEDLLDTSKELPFGGFPGTTKFK